MFFRLFALALFSLFTLYYFAIYKTPQDVEKYLALEEKSFRLRTRTALEDQPAHQIRKKVIKEIRTQDEKRTFIIESETSHLTIEQIGDKLNLQEHLQYVECKTSDGFSLFAKKGLYTYPGHQFILEEDCTLNQNKNTIQGTKLYLDFAQETMICDNPVGFLEKNGTHFQAKQLIWDKKKDKIHLNHSVEIDKPDSFTLYSDFATLDLKANEPALMTLDGNVKLISFQVQNKESWALADSLIYDPLEKTLCFSAKKRVLFWQEGLTLSASKVLIQKDQSVFGQGDVHFSFDLEEQQYIDQLIEKYL